MARWMAQCVVRRPWASGWEISYKLLTVCVCVCVCVWLRENEGDLGSSSGNAAQGSKRI